MDIKAVLKYPGSKWSIADWIINNFPEHHSYVEPYFGSGAVFFSMVPSAIETINDFDDDVINLYKCIRDNPEELARKITMTPYARKIYDLCFEAEPIDPIERARQFLIQDTRGAG